MPHFSKVLMSTTSQKGKKEEEEEERNEGRKQGDEDQIRGPFRDEIFKESHSAEEGKGNLTLWWGFSRCC